MFFFLLVSLLSFERWAKNPVVVLDTSYGSIEIELLKKKAPVTVKNFLRYVDDKFYNGLIFHRVVDNFMIQGGGYDEHFNEKNPREPIVNEASNGLLNDAGTIAMARTSDPDSATSQFFLNATDNRHLNYPSPDGHGYAVFGRVIRGMSVIKRIEKVKTGNFQGHQNVPLEAVIMRSVRRNNLMD